MAVTIQRDALKAAVNGLTDDAEADRLLAMATALIEAEVVDLDDVPDAIANEAVARIVQWSRQTRQTLGQLESEPRQQAVSPVRVSGARAMLAPWLDLGADRA